MSIQIKKPAYKIEDICHVYKASKLNQQTVRKWIKKEGLKTITTYPYLINGKDLKSFLENNNNKDKDPLDFNKFACFACKKHVAPKGNTMQYLNPKVKDSKYSIYK